MINNINDLVKEVNESQPYGQYAHQFDNIGNKLYNLSLMTNLKFTISGFEVFVRLNDVLSHLTINMTENKEKSRMDYAVSVVQEVISMDEIKEILSKDSK